MLPPPSRFSGAAGFNTPEDGPKWTFEALTGMRCWRVEPDGRLVSPVYTGYAWSPGVNTAGHDVYTPLGPTSAAMTAPAHSPCPARDCSAGFYAYHAEDYWYGSTSGYTSQHPWISGLIAGWGRVVNGPKGFRCAKATIMALCLPVQQPKRWEALEQVVQFGSWEAWVEFAHEAIHETYPIVPVFDSVEDMLARIPLQGAA